MKTELEHLEWCIAEEAAEITHRMGKIGRFGLNDKSPTTGIQNLVSLDNEVHDLIAVYEMFQSVIGVGAGKVKFNRSKINDKKMRVIKYMEYAREAGTLEPITK